MEDSPTINNNVSFYKKVTTIDDEQKEIKYIKINMLYVSFKSSTSRYSI